MDRGLRRSVSLLDLRSTIENHGIAFKTEFRKPFFMATVQPNWGTEAVERLSYAKRES
jgi:hypothetical protein